MEVVATTVSTQSPGNGARQPVPDGASRAAAARYGVDLDAVLSAERARGRVGEVIRVPVTPPALEADPLPARWLLVGVGSAAATDLRRAGAALGRAVRGRATLATSLLSGRSREQTRAAVEGLLLGGYSAPATGIKNREGERAVAEVIPLGRVNADAVAAGERHAAATVRARILAVTPSSTKNPGWMVQQAREAAEAAGLGIEVWDADRLARDGFGALLAVGGGSATPPALVGLEHTPDGDADADSTRPPIVLVGKGITFDTGGISLKPREAMVPMKTDMSGSAVVLAVLSACRDAGVRRRVVGLMPLAENAIGAGAYRPGDVVRCFGGRTVEIANTDAEGRMVLADAMAYADAVLDPEVLIDVATLTGAATLGLGRRHAALYTADDALARALQSAAALGGEQVWRMPLVADYAPAIRSDVADLRHIPADPSIGGGSITAALFLQEFAGRRRWAHLDIAGVGRADKDEHEVAKGATGFGARLLLRYLESLR